MGVSGVIERAGARSRSSIVAYWERDDQVSIIFLLAGSRDEEGCRHHLPRDTLQLEISLVSAAIYLVSQRSSRVSY